MIKRKVKVFSIGLMVESMKESGLTESNMESEFTHQLQERQKRADGKKEREWSGCDKH